MRCEVDIIAELYDPSLGSEFIVPNVAIDIIQLKKWKKVRIHTLKRGNNIYHIRKHLDNLIPNITYDLKVYTMSYSDDDGNHRNKAYLLLELFMFYRKVIKYLKYRNSLVWKVGQVNYILNFIFVILAKNCYIGPISGFFIPPIFVKYMPLTLSLKYFLYGLLIKFTRRPFVYLLRSRNFRVFAATRFDSRLLKDNGIEVEWLWETRL
ncbi:MAG: hypothetical protein P8H25_03080 [Flavobacteriaceae bacterium]|nr:hypothetical protein [Flavobacteriaceae bacterium]